MEVKSLYCPNCGSSVNLDIASERTKFYCIYCGQSICLDDGVKRTEHTERIINETEIRKTEIESETEVKLTQLQIELEKLRMKEREIERKEKKLEDEERARRRKPHADFFKKRLKCYAIITLIGGVTCLLGSAIGIREDNPIAILVMMVSSIGLLIVTYGSIIHAILYFKKR